jgi:hypothetical protein
MCTFVHISMIYIHKICIHLLYMHKNVSTYARCMRERVRVRVRVYYT